MIFQITITFWNTSISISYVRVNFSCPVTTMTGYYKDVVVNNHKLDDLSFSCSCSCVTLSFLMCDTFMYCISCACVSHQRGQKAYIIMLLQIKNDHKLDDLYLSNYHYITFWNTSVSYVRVNFSCPETTMTDYYKDVIVVVNIICTCDTFIFIFMSCVTLSFLCVTLSCAVTVTVFHVNVFRIREVRRQISLCSFK